MDITEKRFEQDIETFFLSKEGGYVSLKSNQFDVNKCMDMETLCRFIAKTQPKQWEKYTRYYGENAQEKLYFRLEKCINEQGLIHVLRHGIEDLKNKAESVQFQARNFSERKRCEKLQCEYSRLYKAVPLFSAQYKYH